MARNNIFFLFFCAVILLLLPAIALSQKTNSDSLQGKKIIVLKFSPLTLLDADAGIQIGIENKISPNFSIQNDFSYLFIRYRIYDVLDVLDSSYAYRAPEKFNYKGFAYRFEARMYLTSSPYGMRGFYFAPQFMYKYVQWKEKQTFNSVDYESTDSKMVYQGNLKLGFQHISNSGFTFDIYGGAGIKYRILELVRRESYYVSTNGNGITAKAVSTENIEQKRTFPAFIAGFKFGWAF